MTDEPQESIHEARGKLNEYLERLADRADAVELPKVAGMIRSARVVLGYEAGGYRVPHCRECGTPRHDPDIIGRINRDRTGS